MAYTQDANSGIFAMTNGPPGKIQYCYHHTDVVQSVVEDAGYFNNLDDNLNLQKGDIVVAYEWSATPFATASLINSMMHMVVTNVIANDAAQSAGQIDLAEWGLTTGLLSSLD